MAKGLFSWFGRGSKDKAAPEETVKTTPVAEQPTPESVVVTPSIEPEITPHVTEAEPAVVEAEAVMTETAEPEVVFEPETPVDDSVSDFIATDSAEVAEFHEETQERPKRAGLFSRLVKGLMRTRESIGAGFMALFRGKKLDDDLFDELETRKHMHQLTSQTNDAIQPGHPLNIQFALLDRTFLP